MRVNVMAKAKPIPPVHLVTPQRQSDLSRAFTHALQILRTCGDDVAYVAGEEHLVLAVHGKDAVSEMKLAIDAVMATHKIIRGIDNGTIIKEAQP